jgi:cyclin T
VNDGLRTSLCLQFKPHEIAAGVIFLAAKFLKVKLPSDGRVAWWQEFKVTLRQLEEISNQILELYEQTNNATPSHRNELAETSGVRNSWMAGKSQSNSKATPSRNA